MSHVKNSKREQIRQKRQRDRQRQRTIILGVVAGVILIVAGLLIYPNFKPIGEIKTANPLPRPSVKEASTGNPDAPVRVEEFADFQCPACGVFSSSLEPRLVNEYVVTGKVYYTFYPFSFIGKESFAAAEAAYCAQDQNKFWEYHDILFINQTGENVGDFVDRRLQAYADKVGLDKNQFNTCYKNGTYKTKVQDNITYGQKLGVNATPSFVVNGKLVSTGQLFETIDQALASPGS